jgi:DNA-binding NarL/FixJ family response regulator
MNCSKEGQLTSKELEILQLSADGMHSGKIASKLGTTEQVVKNIRSVILSKVGCDTFTQAVATALRQGIID